MTNPAEQIEQPDTATGDAGATVPERPSQDDAPPVRRGRGRPPKNPGATPNKETPGAAPKRGRPAGASKKVYSIDEIQLLGKQLVGIHQMAAMMTQIPEAQISDPEGLMMAQSIVNVANQYDLELDGKTGAMIQLLATAAMIYAPRVIMVKRRMSEQAQSGVVQTPVQ